MLTVIIHDDIIIVYHKKEGGNVVASKQVYANLFSSNSDCMRPIGGKCVGNCRKTGGNVEFEW